jgi:hypothetical protein
MIVSLASETDLDVRNATIADLGACRRSSTSRSTTRC